MPDSIRRALCVVPFTACVAIAARAAQAQVYQGNAGSRQVSLTPTGGGLGAARPWGPSDADSREVRAIIEAQLAAFRSDDGEKAFSYASPSIREIFVTAERFMAMVRDGYPVVYRPASVASLLPEVIDTDLIQRVRMTDRHGAAWLAVYQMQRQPDRSWRINGCVVKRDDARTATLS